MPLVYGPRPEIDNMVRLWLYDNDFIEKSQHDKKFTCSENKYLQYDVLCPLVRDPNML